MSSSQPRQLSKGTLGLKFMNKVKPVDLSAPTPAAPPAPSASSTPAASTSASPKKQKRPIATKDSAPTPSTSQRPKYISTPSLLSFPLLSTLSPSTSTQYESFSYTSMPLTSVAISGRMSFGGANKEIEVLMDPSKAAVPAEEDSEEGEERSTKKGKGKKRQNDTPPEKGKKIKMNPTPVRREREGKKNEQGFAVPAGFEGVKRGKKRVQEEEHKWVQKGQMREWDEGKYSDNEAWDENEFDMGSENAEFEKQVDALLSSHVAEEEGRILWGDKKSKKKRKKSRQE